MLLMYPLGVLLCFSGAQLAPSGAGSGAPIVIARSLELPLLVEEQLVVVDEELVVVVDDEEPCPSCAALEAATPLLAKASLARPRSRVMATRLVGAGAAMGAGTTPRVLWRQGQASKNGDILSLRTRDGVSVRKVLAEAKVRLRAQPGLQTVLEARSEDAGVAAQNCVCFLNSALQPVCFLKRHWV